MIDFVRRSVIYLSDCSPQVTVDTGPVPEEKKKNCKCLRLNSVVLFERNFPLVNKISHVESWCVQHGSVTLQRLRTSVL